MKHSLFQIGSSGSIAIFFLCICGHLGRTDKILSNIL
jgi:hypothetical protein